VAAGRRYYLDTNVVISVVEATNAFGAAQLRFIERIDAGEIEAVTSELTLAECLVKPFADRDVVAIAAYLSFLAGRKELPVLPVSRGVLLDAARLRSELHIKFPDAIHIATAISAGCDSFLTSDRGIKLPDKLVAIWWDRLAEEG
jgi:predicted nucleic acid-binding protein